MSQSNLLFSRKNKGSQCSFLGLSSAFLHYMKLLEQDKSSDIEQQPPFSDRKISNIQSQNRAGVQNQQEHHIILTKYEAVHPTAVSENYSSSGMLII